MISNYRISHDGNSAKGITYPRPGLGAWFQGSQPSLFQATKKSPQNCVQSSQSASELSSHQAAAKLASSYDQTVKQENLR